MFQQTVLISLPLEQLETLIDNAIGKAIKEYSLTLQNKEQESKPEYYTRKQLAETLHLSLGTLDQYVKCGLIKSYKIGHRVLFKTEEVNDSLFQSVLTQKHKTK